MFVSSLLLFASLARGAGGGNDDDDDDVGEGELEEEHGGRNKKLCKSTI